MQKKITNLLAIISPLIFIYLVNFLNKKIENIPVLCIGIFFLYLITYIFVYSMQSIFNRVDYPQMFVLGSLFAYYFQKHDYVFKEVWRISHKIRNVNYTVLLFFILLLFVFFMKKKYKFKEAINLENIRNTLLYMISFFVLRGKEYKIGIFFLLITLIVFIQKKDWKNIKDIEKKIKIFLFISVYIFFCWISKRNIFISPFGNELFRAYLQSFILLTPILLIPISKEMYKKIRINLLISCMFPILLALLEWIKFNYSFFQALGTKEWTSIWAVQAVLISTIYIFFYFYEKKIILLYFSFLSILTMFLAQGRGPFLAFFIVLIFLSILFSYSTKSVKYFLWLILFLALLCILIFFTNNYILYKVKVVLQGKDNSTIIRLKLYEAAVEQWKTSKYLGYGLGSLKETAEMLGQNSILVYDLDRIPHAHNNILELLRSVGLIGLFSYIFMQFYFLLNLWKKFLRTKNYIYFLPIFLIFGFELAGVTDYTLMMYKSISLWTFIIYIFLALDEKEIITLKEDFS